MINGWYLPTNLKSPIVRSWFHGRVLCAALTRRCGIVWYCHQEYDTAIFWTRQNHRAKQTWLGSWCQWVGCFSWQRACFITGHTRQNNPTHFSVNEVYTLQNSISSIPFVSGSARRSRSGRSVLGDSKGPRICWRTAQSMFSTLKSSWIVNIHSRSSRDNRSEFNKIPRAECTCCTFLPTATTWQRANKWLWEWERHLAVCVGETKQTC